MPRPSSVIAAVIYAVIAGFIAFIIALVIGAILKGVLPSSPAGGDIEKYAGLFGLLIAVLYFLNYYFGTGRRGGPVA